MSHVGVRGTDCVSLFFPVVSSFCLSSDDWLRTWTFSSMCHAVSLHGAAESSWCLFCTHGSWFDHWCRLKGNSSTWTKIPLPKLQLLLWPSLGTAASGGDCHWLPNLEESGFLEVHTISDWGGFVSTRENHSPAEEGFLPLFWVVVFFFFNPRDHTLNLLWDSS